MLSAIALMPIFGYPAVMYGGIFTLLLLIFQAVMGYRINKGICKLPNPLAWHKAVSLLVLILALAHGLLGLSVIIGF